MMSSVPLILTFDASVLDAGVVKQHTPGPNTQVPRGIVIVAHAEAAGRAAQTGQAGKET